MAKAFLVVLCAAGISASVGEVDTCDGDCTGVQLLQTRAKIETDPKPANLKKWTGTTFFVDSSKTICAEGEAADAEGALAIKKAGILGNLYHTSSEVSYAFKGTCAKQGYDYTEQSSADPCFPGITLYYKNEAGAKKAAEMQNNSLKTYAKQFGLSEAKVQTMHDCTCHQKSARRGWVALTCPTELFGLKGSFLHDLSQNSSVPTPLLCTEAPFYYSVMNLALAKTNGELTMHWFDQVHPQGCAERNFPTKVDHAEPCYMGATHYTKSANWHNDTSLGITAGWQQEMLKPGSLYEQFIATNKLNADVFLQGTNCHCSPKSPEFLHMCPNVSYVHPVRDSLQEE